MIIYFNIIELHSKSFNYSQQGAVNITFLPSPLVSAILYRLLVLYLYLQELSPMGHCNLVINTFLLSPLGSLRLELRQSTPSPGTSKSVDKE